MRVVDNNLAHAISAYGYSGFEDSAVVVMDGRGAWEATSIWHGHGGRLEQYPPFHFQIRLDISSASSPNFLVSNATVTSGK